MIVLHIGPLSYNPVQPLGFMHLVSSLSIFGVCTSVKLNTKGLGLIPDLRQSNIGG